MPNPYQPSELFRAKLSGREKLVDRTISTKSIQIHPKIRDLQLKSNLTYIDFNIETDVKSVWNWYIGHLVRKFFKVAGIENQIQMLLDFDNECLCDYMYMIFNKGIYLWK